MDIRLLGPEEWHVLRATRMRALRDSPDAFLAPYDQEVRWSEARWRRRVATAAWAVGVEHGEVIGIAGLIDGCVGDGPHIEGTWVAPGHRRRGVFRALLTALVGLARDNGVRAVALWVLEDNVNARQVYARLGFVSTGERQHLSGGRYELRLRLPIAPPG